MDNGHAEYAAPVRQKMDHVRTRPPSAHSLLDVIDSSSCNSYALHYTHMLPCNAAHAASSKKLDSFWKQPATLLARPPRSLASFLLAPRLVDEGEGNVFDVCSLRLTSRANTAPRHTHTDTHTGPQQQTRLGRGPSISGATSCGPVVSPASPPRLAAAVLIRPGGRRGGGRPEQRPLRLHAVCSPWPLIASFGRAGRAGRARFSRAASSAPPDAAMHTHASSYVCTCYPHDACRLGPLVRRYHHVCMYVRHRQCVHM